MGHPYSTRFPPTSSQSHSSPWQTSSPSKSSSRPRRALFLAVFILLVFYISGYHFSINEAHLSSIAKYSPHSTSGAAVHTNAESQASEVETERTEASRVKDETDGMEEGPIVQTEDAPASEPDDADADSTNEGEADVELEAEVDTEAEVAVSKNDSAQQPLTDDDATEDSPPTSSSDEDAADDHEVPAKYEAELKEKLEDEKARGQSKAMEAIEKGIKDAAEDDDEE